VEEKPQSSHINILENISEKRRVPFFKRRIS
jgi:hypothetical protein